MLSFAGLSGSNRLNAAWYLYILISQSSVGLLRPRNHAASDEAATPSPIGSENMAEMEDRWLSVDEIGKHLGVSNDTVYRWIDKHAMPAHRMGRFWKFKKVEVDEWVKGGGAAETSKGERSE
jgi:excisionase family DNA binding protein